MLKKIAVEDVRLGMHLHAMAGAWLEHPFWKTKFVLRDPDDLQKLRGSAVREVWIDIAKGLDVSSPHGDTDGVSPRRDGHPGVYASPASDDQVATTEQVPEVAPVRESLASELQRATRIVQQSRQALSSLFNEARMGKALDAEKCVPLVDQIATSIWRNPGAIVSLARLKTHDDYTYMHSMAVCALMISLGRQLGMDEGQAREAGLAGMLHDLGKSAMPLPILNKPGKLSNPEMEVMRSHPKAGYEMLNLSKGVGPAVLDVCLHHHERPDGQGYPDGLAGDDLSLMARMGAVCDVYDAITSNRPYKSGWDPAESIAKMASWQGQFDKDVFQAFVRSLGIYPVGSLVRMQSGKLGVVVEQASESPASPKVKVFFSTRSNMPISAEVIDLSSARCHDAILGRESNDQWKFPHLNELWGGTDAARRIQRA